MLRKTAMTLSYQGIGDLLVGIFGVHMERGASTLEYGFINSCVSIGGVMEYWRCLAHSFVNINTHLI